MISRVNRRNDQVVLNWSATLDASACK
jgi:hypothetical protein